MNRVAIQETIDSLLAQTETLQRASTTFKEKLYCAYQIQLLMSLQKCESIANFQQVLADNWAQVMGNALCYTARPDDALTILLYNIADYVGEKLKVNDKFTVFPIQILMPGVVTDSIYTDKDSAYQDYPDLTKLSLEYVLKTHILSDSGRYLLPVRTLLELPDPWDDNAKPFPIYYQDFTNTHELTFVSEKELNRLRLHSVHTEALFSAKENYAALVENSGLLGHLRTLIRALTANSTSGTGTEEAAGQGAYAALEDFTRYYQSLGDIAQQIPEDLRLALDTLISIASDHEKNRTATIQESCINARHKALSNLVKKHEDALMPIGVDSHHKEQLLKVARKRFEENKTALRMLLISNQLNYRGQDALGLTHTLLKSFDVTPTITSMATLQDFLSLSPNEITTIATQEAAVKEGILQQLPNLEAFVHFCLLTPLEPLTAILSVIGNSLSAKLITTPKDISASLMLMEGPRLERMIQLLAERFSTLITSSDSFAQVLENLSPDQRSAFYEALKDSLPHIIQNSTNFWLVLTHLTTEQRVAFYEMFKAKLPTIIHNSHDFMQVLEFLNLEQRTTVFEELKDQLSGFIKCGYDFRQVFQFLSPIQRCSVYVTLKTQLPSIIKNSHDFGQALQHLDSKQCLMLCEDLKVQLPTIIKSGYDFGHSIAHLSLEQRNVIYEVLKGTLPNIIQNGFDFGQAIQHLLPEQRAAVYEAVKDRLPGLIRNGGEDFGQVLKHLNLEQCSAVCEANKLRLPAMIEGGYELGKIFSVISLEQCSAVCESLKTELLAIFKSGSDFGISLEYLSSDQRNVIYSAARILLPDLIKSGTDFGQAIEYLSLEQSSEIYEALKDRLPSLIKNGTDLGRALQHLDDKQCNAVCESFKVLLPTILKSCTGVGQALRFLKAEQCSAVCETLKMQLADMFTNTANLEQAFKTLKAEQRSAIFYALQDKLPKIINNANEFCRAKRLLNSSERMAFFNLFKTQLLDKIAQGEDFIHLPVWLASKKCFKALGVSAEKKQRLYEEIKGILLTAKPQKSKVITPQYEKLLDSLAELNISGDENKSSLDTTRRRRLSI